VTRPYVLAVASHKGGTGRTTTALSLAWAFAQAGRSVSFIDADAQRSASLMALDAGGKCQWPGVRFRAGLEALGEELDGDLVVVDSPPLTDRTSRPVLHLADGLVLTCLADPLSIRTIPAAAGVIESAKTVNSSLDLLGILICIYNAQDPVQAAMMDRLGESHPDILLRPAIPFQTELRDWPLRPGTPPPGGSAADAFAALANGLDASTRVCHA
jgi:cellulose biosynthesis protein BcsQ